MNATLNHRAVNGIGQVCRVTLYVALLGVSAGCGDDEPTPWSATITRTGADVTATPSAIAPDTHVADTTPADVTSPDTTPADTTPADTTPADTTPADTTLAGDVGPDVAPGDFLISVPPLVALPWVPADGSASTRAVVATLSAGSASTQELASIEARLDGDSAISVTTAVSENPRGVSLAFRFHGASSHTRAETRLSLVRDGNVIASATIFALAGSVTPLPSATWTDHRSEGVLYGKGTTIRLETAPFPHSSGSWTDSSVHIFVPDGFTPRASNDFVVHFHGHYATVAATLPAHYYREQVWASGANTILVVPQGPVSAASGNFGKLMTAPGLTRLLDDVVAVLYRDGLVLSPWVADLVLTEHSGGYIATAANLGTVTDRGQVMSAHLFDGLYGRSSDYDAFARAGGFLRSDHTSGGGTRTNNTALLGALGALATSDASFASLRNGRAVIWPTRAGHNDSTWWDAVFAETLRWGTVRSRRGPRIELRSVVVAGDQLQVKWFSPADDLLEAFVVETSRDGIAYQLAAETTPDASAATIALPAGSDGLFVRVRSRLDDVGVASSLVSDTYYAGRNPDVLVVDGFDRMLDGSWRHYAHTGAGRVGAALGGVATASNEAVLAGDVSLGTYPVVIWLLGDESSANETFSAGEQALVTSYLASGGRVIASGSEIAWDLGARGNGSAFLSRLGATYTADNARATSARGTGDLASIASFSFAGADALYPEDFPDVVSAATDARVILTYPDGKGAGVGIRGKSAVIGFPLELVGPTDTLRQLLEALVAFVNP